MPLQYVLPPPRVRLQPTDYVVVDHPLRHHPQRAVGQCGFPAWDTAPEAAVGIEKLPARFQYPSDLVQEPPEVGVVDRGLDIDHRIESVILERQVFSITFSKLQTRNVMAAPIERDGVRVHIETDIDGWFEGPC